MTRSAVEVVVPWLPGCAHRERAFRLVLDRHAYPVRIATGSRPWVKALAVMPEIRASRASVVIVADADCWCEGLGAAVAAVEAGAPWAVPHGHVHRLTEAASRQFDGSRDYTHADLVQEPYRGYLGGGFVIARRETLLDIPLDPLFVGWGQEDEAWAAALQVLAGEPWRGTEPLIHLWHPPQPRDNRVIGSTEGWLRRRAYFKARGHNDRAAMRALLRQGSEVAIVDLINQPCTLYRTSSGAVDAYGRPSRVQVAVNTVCAIQQQSRQEPLMEGDLSDTRWSVFFLPSEIVGSGDSFYVEGLGMFEITGGVWPVHDPRSSGYHHLEGTARRTAGPEDGS